MHPTPALGIDIAQLTFAAALRLDEQRSLKARFDNRPAGFRKLHRWRKTHGVGPLRVGVESTNVYAEALAHWLHAAAYQVICSIPSARPAPPARKASATRPTPLMR